MILFSIEEFAARRRKTQTDLESALRGAVKRAVDLGENTDGWRELLLRVNYLFTQVYQEESGEEWSGSVRTWRNELETTLRKTKDRDKNSVERITVWLATAILSKATIEASVADEAELFLTWTTMNDDAVREIHAAADGQIRPIGETFLVGGEKMRYPGDPRGSQDNWQGCRCVLHPVLAEEALMASVSDNTSTVVVALPAESDPVHAVGEEQKHITLAYLGECDDETAETCRSIASEGAATMEPFTAAVSGYGVLGPDKAKVLFVEAEQINQARDLFISNEQIGAAMAADAHPHFSPHCTCTYDDEMPTEATELTEMQIDRIAVWQGETQTEYPLGETMPEEVVEETVDDTMAALPWHGVIAPEGVPSGDGRMFAPDSLRMRDLPLPLTWQKESSEGHNGSVTVAKIEAIERRDGLMCAWGHFLDTPEANEVVGLLAEFGKFGVSVDADDATFEIDESNEMVVFTSARIASASIVAIPAFSEAFVALGMWDEEEDPAIVDRTKDKEGEDKEDEDEDENLYASVEQFLDAVTDHPETTGTLVAWPAQWSPAEDPSAVAVGARCTTCDGGGTVTFSTRDVGATWSRILPESQMTSAGRGRGRSTATAMAASTSTSAPSWRIAASMNSEWDRFRRDLFSTTSAGTFGVSTQDISNPSQVSKTSSGEVVCTALCAPCAGRGSMMLRTHHLGTFGTKAARGPALPASVRTTDAQRQNVALAFARGPGWLTNPVETRRIWRYWTQPGQEGYAKIGWGTPNDFYRCRTLVGAKIAENSPEDLVFLNQICARWHHDALGFWPGNHASAKDVLTDTAPADALTLVASVLKTAPAEWFTNPNLETLTPLNVTDEGRVFGHVAGWDSCHIGYPGTCTAAPKSRSSYAYFLTGEVALDNGTRVPTGPLTIGGGHADGQLGMRAALEHYDSTSSVVADVTVGEDDHGIWFSGWVRPGVSDEMVTALQASALSGDWRRVAGQMEMIAALAVNTPGFHVPRVAASGQGQLSLVASGVVDSLPPLIDMDALSAAVAVRLGEIEQRKATMAALAERIGV